MTINEALETIINHLNNKSSDRLELDVNNEAYTCILVNSTIPIENKCEKTNYIKIYNCINPDLRK